ERAKQRWVHLRHALWRQQPVLFLLHVGKLRVAKTHHRPGAHQRIDERAIRPDECVLVRDLEPAPSARSRNAQTPKLADDHGLAAVAVAGAVDDVAAGAAVKGGIEA